MAYLIYGNDGGIDEVLALIKEPKELFHSIDAAFDRIVEDHKGSFAKRDLFLSVIYF